MELINTKLGKFYLQNNSIRIDEDGVLEVRVSPRRKAKWCAVYPPSTRKTVICPPAAHDLVLAWYGSRHMEDY